MPKIFIIQEVKNHDYSPAKEFGDLIFINKEDINTRISLTESPRNRDLLLEIADAIANKWEDGDFLVFDGNLIAMAITLSYIMEKYNSAQILKWDNRANKYQLTYISQEAWSMGRLIAESCGQRRQS